METSRQFLVPALSLAIALAAAYYAWNWMEVRQAEASPEVLADAALTLPLPAERERAAAALAAAASAENRKHLRRVYRQSNSPSVRAACISGMGRGWDYASMESLLTALEDESPLVRGRAGAAVQEMLGVDFFYRAMDPPEKRKEVVKKMRAAWRTMRSSGRLEEWNERREAAEG